MGQDFSAALRQIPLDVPYRHHGRSVETGLDCIGLVLAVYRLAGCPLDDLDEPYGIRDALRPERARRLIAKTCMRFTKQDVTASRQCRDGDLLLMGDNHHINHLAMVVDGTMVQMAGKIGTVSGRPAVIGGKLRITPLNRGWAFVRGVYRRTKE
jgi:cell wall-associated NlpC family hydrolase